MPQSRRQPANSHRCGAANCGKESGTPILADGRFAGSAAKALDVPTAARHQSAVVVYTSYPSGHPFAGPHGPF